MSLHLAMMANIQSSTVLYRCSAEILTSCWIGHELKMGIPNLMSVCENLYVIQNVYCSRHTESLASGCSGLSELSKCVCVCVWGNACTCMCVRMCIQNQSHKRSSQTADVQSSALEGWLISRFVLNINSHLIHRHQNHKATEFRTPRTRLAE